MQITTATSRTITTASQRARRLTRPATLAACAIAALAALAAPGMASAADTVVAPDPAADQVTALDGTVVWVSGTFGDQVLMQRTPAGVIARVKDAPRAAMYSDIDLGHDSKGRLVLTYMRCSKNDCTVKRDNLDGKRASFKNLTLKRCHLSTAPAVWGTRLAYGLYCSTPNNVSDGKRSGLYVKNGAGSPRRLRLPRDAVKAGATGIASVDLRGMRVAAIAADIAEYAFTETVNGNGLRSLKVALSEGEQEEDATGVSLGTSNAMWTLVDSYVTDYPNRADIFKVSRTCSRLESLVNPSGPNQQQGFPATDLAVDRTTLYLVVPGTGIVKHDFAPQGDCLKR